MISAHTSPASTHHFATLAEAASASSTPAEGRLDPRATVSFEVMPPRNPQAAPKFWSTVDRLIAARPDFISITYGAGGQDRRGAREAASIIAQHSPTPPIAHLTCVGTSAAEIRAITNEYLDAGIRTFLALRGDPPAGNPHWRPAGDALTSAADLIRLLREVEFTRCAAHPGTALRGSLAPLRIGVAAFPCGNPAAGTTRSQEVERLVAKQVAGADFAITQMLWRAEDYHLFVSEARAAGVTIPIIPGILPPVEVRRLHRVAELTGVEAPRDLLHSLKACVSEAHARTIGIGIAARLASDLIEAGAPGVHLYTFNRAEPSLATLHAAKLLLPA